MLEMKPIDTDRILPIEAIPMRILPDFRDRIADVGVITLLPAEDENPASEMTHISAGPTEVPR